MASWTLMHMLLNVPEQRTTDWWWQAGLSNQNCFRVFSNYCKTIYILSAHYLVLESYMNIVTWLIQSICCRDNFVPLINVLVMSQRPASSWWRGTLRTQVERVKPGGHLMHPSLSPAAFTISFRLAQVTQDEWVRLTALRNISSPSSNSRASQSITLPQSFKPCSNGRMTM